MTEAQIQHAILAAWGSHPRIRIARINTGVARFGPRTVRFNPPGTADIVGLIAPSGRMLMIEVKAARGQQRDAQAAMERVVTAFGGLYILARDLDTVDRALAREGITR